jgi:small subunit ribosomal protein S6
MFLFDPTAATDWATVETEVGRMMNRASAELLTCKKWEERRLAYEIKGRNRGCYVLTYFKAAPESLAHIERDVQLSDQVLRCLLLRADHVSEEKMNEPTPAESTTRPHEDGRPPSFEDSNSDSSGAKPGRPHHGARMSPASEDEETLAENTETAESN